MTETTAPMHQEPASAPESSAVKCGTCPKLFTPKKPWQRFCSTTCRNAFHTAEAHKEAVRKAAPDLYDALLAARQAMRGKDLEHVWVNYPTEPALELGTLADRALAKAGFKPPKT